jgi:hypothetical protein
MPAQPLWLDRLPEILNQVAAPDAPLWWDRAAVEKLFGLRRRRAISLLHQMGAAYVGKNLAIERSALRRFLEQPRRQDAYQEEQTRSAQVATRLGQARQQQHARRIRIATPAAPERLDFAGLPAGIDLQRRQLTIAYETPAELLEKLVALAQALLNDYETFEAQLAPLETSV